MFKHYRNQGVEWNALFAGEIVKTKSKHFAMLHGEWMYVCETKPPYRLKTLEENRQWMLDNAKEMTIKSYVELYQQSRKKLHTSERKGLSNDSFDQRSVW